MLSQVAMFEFDLIMKSPIEMSGNGQMIAD